MDWRCRRSPSASSPTTKGCTSNATGIEQIRNRRVANPQMLDPDRGIDEGHSRSGRRRGAVASSGSLPPRRASRRALSFDERLQRFANERRLLPQPGKCLGFGQELIIESDRRPNQGWSPQQRHDISIVRCARPSSAACPCPRTRNPRGFTQPAAPAASTGPNRAPALLLAIASGPASRRGKADSASATVSLTARLALTI